MNTAMMRASLLNVDRVYGFYEMVSISVARRAAQLLLVPDVNPSLTSRISITRLYSTTSNILIKCGPPISSDGLVLYLCFENRL